ncbi:hypothetical protein AB0H63_16550 [Micromonospora echinospora]|uniref:hypothetical protein n=1 Tax=Micromonospora echinospora TaxID=1877 RepID=UPI0033D1B6B0
MCGRSRRKGRPPLRRAAITSPSAPNQGRHAPPGSAGWIRIARAAVLVVTGVGAALLAVAISAAPARAETGEGGGEPGRLAEVVTHVRQLGRGEIPAVPSREPAAAPAGIPLRAGRPAVDDRKRLPVAPARPAPMSPTAGEAPLSRRSDREAGTRPRPEPVVPRIVSRILPPRAASPADPPVAPVDGPVRPPVSAPPATPDGAAPTPVTSRPRPPVPVAPPRPVPDGGPGGPVDGPAVPAPEPASPPGRIPLPPRLVGVLDGALRPILDLLTDVLGGVLAPILDLPGGGGDPPLPPGSAPPATPVPAPVPDAPVPDSPADGPPAPGPLVPPPWVHNGALSPSGPAGSGESWSPVWVPGPGSGHRAVPAAPTLGSGSASGDSSDVPVAPGDDRVSGDSGPRAGASLPPETSHPDRSVRHALAEVPPAPARGRSPTVAARPG